jgi:hypothetical protein
MSKLTFREELTLEADNNASNIDIGEDIENIKKKIKEAVDHRNFTVCLVQVKPHKTVAIGGYRPTQTEIFIPNFIAPLHYRQLFINEFTKLGFTEENVELDIKDYNSCKYYNIKLTW